MKIARVFPRITKATPMDNLCFFSSPEMFMPEIDEVHVSVTFTWDIPKAEKLAKQWSCIAPVKIGGPAFKEPGWEFDPGKYLRRGYTITSRGCPNHCWFCQVPKQEKNGLKELEIKDGWNVLDDNLLACSEDHIRDVFAMLKRQKHQAEFTGGLEAAILKPWHVDLLLDLKPKQMFFAYDTPDDYDPLVYASTMLRDAGFSRNQLRAYVLIGYKGDTFSKAEKRLTDVVKLGIFPMAMLYMNKKGQVNEAWKPFQRLWARPAIIAQRIKSVAGSVLSRD